MKVSMMPLRIMTALCSKPRIAQIQSSQRPSVSHLAVKAIECLIGLCIAWRTRKVEDLYQLRDDLRRCRPEEMEGEVEQY